jgi:hypothetical protein
MEYACKNIWQKPGADVLLEVYLGPISAMGAIFDDPRVIGYELYRSPDRSYAELFFVWRSKQQYDEWNADHHHIHIPGQLVNDEYFEQMNLNFERIYPESDYQERTDPRFKPYSGQLDRITYEDIFKPIEP